MSKNDTTPIARQNHIVVQEYGREVLIYDLLVHKAFSLNETSALVWRACDGSRTVGEISRQITRQLNSPVSEEFVWLALEQLKREKLLENEAEVEPPFEAASRREVIRRVGLASLAALPVVFSILAPTAAHAQSGVCAAGSCRCPNGSAGCNGSTATVGGVSYVNCFSASGNNPSCDCVGPFGPPNSAGIGFQAGIGCRSN